MSQALEWLLEQDEENPGVRYFALRDLQGQPVDAPEVIDARQSLMGKGPVPAILAAQDAAGYWEKPGTGYYPKYRGTAWSIIYLAQLGADPGRSAGPGGRRVPAGQFAWPPWGPLA